MLLSSSSVQDSALSIDFESFDISDERSKAATRVQIPLGALTYMSVPFPL